MFEVRFDEGRPLAHLPRQTLRQNSRLNCAGDGVAASIREFRFRQPIVADSDGVIICGKLQGRTALGLERRASLPRRLHARHSRWQDHAATRCRSCGTRVTTREYVIGESARRSIDWLAVLTTRGPDPVRVDTSNELGQVERPGVPSGRVEDASRAWRQPLVRLPGRLRRGSQRARCGAGRRPQAVERASETD